MVGVFVSDFKEYCYLPNPLVAFHPPSPNASLQRSVLGLTGFLQHFRFIIDYDSTQPTFELHPKQNFPGQTGVLPKTGAVVDFVRQLHSP